MRKFYQKNFLITFTFILFLSFFIFSNQAIADAFEELGAYSSKGLTTGSKGFANGAFVEAICDIFGLFENELGAFLTSATLVVALVSAAAGAIAQTRAAVIVAVSAFSITTIVSLYFGTFTCS